MLKTIHLQYCAALREERGLSKETFETGAQNVQELYLELKKKYNFKLPIELVKVAINDEFCGLDKEIKSGDLVIFIPPVAG